MARDRGTTFDEAKSFIDRLMDSGSGADTTATSSPVAQNTSFNILDVQNNRGGRRNMDGSSSKKAASGLSLEDEINMMFARSSSAQKPSVTAAARSYKKPYKQEGSLGELLFSQINVQKKVKSRSPGGQIKEDSPNELVILSDGEGEQSRRGEKVRKRLGDEYCEELLNRGKNTVPIYDNGLVYGGSPTRDISPDPLNESPVQDQFRKSVCKDGGRIHRTPRQYRKKSPSKSPQRQVAKVKPSSSRSPEKQKKSPILEPQSQTKSKEVKRSSKISCKTCQFTIPREGFMCRICKKNYLMETELAIHMKAKHQLRVPMTLNCSLCEKELADVASLHRHLTSKHLCKEHLKCPFECDILLSTETMKQHLDEEHNRNYCNDCGKDYNKAKVHSCKARKKVGIDKGELHSLLSGADDVFSDEELKFVEVNEQTETVSFVKDELVVVHLGGNADGSGPCLNVRRNRAGLVPTVSMSFSKDVIESRDFEMYARNGLFFCKTCPLVYDPLLKMCAECDLLFLDAKDLALHAIEVHKCAMDVTNVECEYCEKSFDSYKELVSHRGSHFCKEHTECTEGCKELVIGRKQALSVHEKLAHDSNPKSSSIVFLGHVSSEAAEVGKEVKVQNSNLVKCCNCRMKVPSGFELICDKCSRDNQLKFYSQDELTLHQEKQHRISKKGRFVCSLGETEKIFEDDLEGLINYRNKTYKICKNHVKCPRTECGAIMCSGKLENHLRKECDYVSTSDWTLHPWFVFPNTEIKACSLDRCTFALQTTKLYKCPECNAVMADKLEFYAHLKLDHKHDELTHDVNFSCTQCMTSDVRFSVARWRSHRKDKHGFCSNHFVCVNMSCHLMFDSLSALRKHLLSDRCKFKLTAKPAEFLGEKVCLDCNQVKAETVARFCALCVSKPGSRPFTDNEEYSMHLTFRHSKTVQTITPIRCGSCKTTLDNFAELGSHRIRKHKICNKHVFCRSHESCQFVFHFKEDNRTHVCSAEKSKPGRITPFKSSFSALKSFFKCADCSFTTNIRTSRSFICEFDACHKSFILQNELCDHQSKRHKLNISGTFQCFRCPGTPSFPNAPEKLAEHNQRVHKFCRFHKKCPTPGCNWLFVATADIDEHMQWCLGLKKYADQLPSSSKSGHHKEAKSPEKPSSRDKEKVKRRNSVPEEGEWTADNLGQGKRRRESPSKDITTQFSRKATIAEPVLFQCVDCSKKFWVDSLTECVKCGDDVPKSQKRFLSRTEMTAHLESEHNLIKFEKSSCSMCGEKFDKCSELQKHTRSAHGSCESHFPCEFCVTGCSKMFGTLEKLQAHYAAEHFGEKLDSLEPKQAQVATKPLVNYGAVENEEEEETELKEPQEDILEELDEYAFEEPDEEGEFIEGKETESEEPEKAENQDLSASVDENDELEEEDAMAKLELDEDQIEAEANDSQNQSEASNGEATHHGDSQEDLEAIRLETTDESDEGEASQADKISGNLEEKQPRSTLFESLDEEPDNSQTTEALNSEEDYSEDLELMINDDETIE